MEHSCSSGGISQPVQPMRNVFAVSWSPYRAAPTAHRDEKSKHLEVSRQASVATGITQSLIIYREARLWLSRRISADVAKC